jgi:formate hydrogenlyase subunit 3/multisubunit Na+/H+ antiporter MnhD subunit
MSAQSLLWVPVLVPLAVAVFLLPLFRKSPRAAAGIGLAAVAAAGLAIWVAAPSSPGVSIPWVEGFTIAFSLTGWKTFLLGFVFLFQLLALVYTLGAAMRPERPYLHLFALLVAFSSTYAVILTDNLMVLVIGWELFLVALYLLIHSGGAKAEAAAHKALVIGGTSDFLMLLGLMFYFQLAPGGGMTAGVDTASGPMAFWSFVLIFLGAGAKAGMFPFHTWIPDAAEVMPASGFAALPASLEKVLGIYFLFVVTQRMFVIDAAAQTVMFLFGIVTVFVTIVPALVEKDLRRILALTAISPVGFMVCGMAVSEAAGVAGALLYMLAHAAYKSTMFFAAGNFVEKAGGAGLDRLLGIARSMPYSGATISLPPTGGFMAKELILEGALHGGHLAVLALLVVGAVLNVAVFAKVVAVLWAPGGVNRGEAPGACILAPLVMGAVAVLGGFIFSRSDALVSSVAGAHGPGLTGNVWHFSILAVVSLGIYAVGFMIYASARTGRASAAETFASLRTSPVLGSVLTQAEAGRFDGYEIGVRTVDAITRVVFRFIERKIDVVGAGVIALGCAVLRPLLSGAHNGIYGNYLCWALVGFLVVLFLLFGSAA